MSIQSAPTVTFLAKADTQSLRVARYGGRKTAGASAALLSPPMHMPFNQRCLSQVEPFEVAQGDAPDDQDVIGRLLSSAHASLRSAL